MLTFSIVAMFFFVHVVKDYTRLLLK
jgi:hypothetical protein